MSFKVMIIDGAADFRSLLMHHVTTHWPDAIISAYDPILNGRLPDQFAGAGNDVVLLGEEQGNVDPMKVLAQFTQVPAFPAVFFFGSRSEDRADALKFGATGFFPREKISHAAVIVALSDAVRAQKRTASTDSLFVGDMSTGIYPLIKGYRLIEKLAASEHSAVYLAEREAVGVKVVLKVLRQSPDLAEGTGAFDRFLREYELIADLQHPNIVNIYDLGVSDDHAHIAMEYLNGGDLRQKILSGVSTADAIRYTKEIASALARIHSVGILHRDLKPGNVMLRADNSIALIDFGLATHMRMERETTDAGQIFGTPYYMSPEQGHANEVDARSDIYSLGVIFHELLTGNKPYIASNAIGIIFKHTKAPIPVLPQRYAQYQAILNLLLAKRPEDRIQRADEVLEWL